MTDPISRKVIPYNDIVSTMRKFKDNLEKLAPSAGGGYLFSLVMAEMVESAGKTRITERAPVSHGESTIPVDLLTMRFKRRGFLH